MKKMMLAILILGVFKSDAQTKGWILEDKIVAGHSWLSQTNGNKPHLFMQTGVNVARYHRNFGFGMGIVYSAEGNTEKSFSVDSKDITRFHYVRVPIFIRLISNDALVRPFADAGLSFGFFAGGRSRNWYNGKFTRTSNVYPVNETDIGFLANAGIISKLNKRLNFSYFATYYRGFAQIYALYGGDNDPVIANRNIGLGMGIQYELSR